MTKARTEAQKRRDKKASRDQKDNGMPELAPIKPRMANGRHSRAGDDPQRTVLDARCRVMGKKSTRDTRSAMRMQMAGDPAGQAILIGSRNGEEAKRLWRCFCLLDAADARYHARILGTSRHAKCGKVEYMPERFEARTDDVMDARTATERDHDTINAWMRWHGHVGQLVSHERQAIWDGVYLRGDLQRQGTLTTMGTAFVAALRVLTDRYATRC